jgi:hypothetical protein
LVTQAAENTSHRSAVWHIILYVDDGFSPISSKMALHASTEGSGIEQWV